MRHLISGMVAAVAVMAASPAMACGYSSRSPCAPRNVSPCAQPYVAPVASYGYGGCNTGCGWATERLPDPVQQYYYVNQGPTYTGPGNFAPYPTYQEGGYRHRPYYAPRRSYGPRYSYAPRYHGQRERVLRRY